MFRNSSGNIVGSDLYCSDAGSVTGSAAAIRPVVTIPSISTLADKGYTCSYYQTDSSGYQKWQVGKDIKDFVASLDNESYEYDGSSKTPTVTLVEYDVTKNSDWTETFNSGIILQEYLDYMVDYEYNSDAGTRVVTIRGIGNYAGTKTKTFTILPKSIEDWEISFEDVTYDGTYQTPEPTIKINGDTKYLYDNEDYKVEYSYNKDVGEATAKVIGTGNYTGEKYATFEIKPKTITVTADAKSRTYGEANPEFTYTYYGNVDGETPEFYGNLSTTATTTSPVGKYDITQGTLALGYNSPFYASNYTIDYKKAQLTISQKNMSSSNDVTLSLSKTDYEYNGSAQQPLPIVKDGNTTLSKDTDYTVSYSNNTNAGTGTITVTGKGNYSGTKTINFTVTSIDIDKCMVNVRERSFAYDGTEKKPLPDIAYINGTSTNGGFYEALVKDKDYTVSYSNNTNAGTATITITGKGNYSGTTTATFTITPVELETNSVVLEQQSYEYNGTNIIPTLQVTSNGKTLVENTDYTVACADNVEVGEATVTVKGKNNYSGVITKTFTITQSTTPTAKKQVSECTISLGTTSYVFDGTEKKPTVTIKDGNTTLTEGTDYEVSYSNNTNVGTATVTITGKGNYEGTATRTFEITQSTTPSAKKQMSTCTISLGTTSYVFDGTEKKPTVTVKDGNTTLTEGTDYEVSYSNNTNAGTATVTITGKGDYEGIATEQFTITSSSNNSSGNGNGNINGNGTGNVNEGNDNTNGSKNGAGNSVGSGASSTLSQSSTSGKKDTTTSNSILPAAGYGKIIISAIVAVLFIGIIGYIRYRKMDDIK